MEIVSMVKKKPAPPNLPKEGKPKTKELMITAEAMKAIQLKGKAEYELVFGAFQKLFGVMRGTVLFKDLAEAMQMQLKDALEIQLSLLDPSLSKNGPKSLEFKEQIKDAQRNLFLEYSKVYHLEGITQA